MRLVRTDESLRWDGRIRAGGMGVGVMINGCGWVDELGSGVGLGVG